MKLKLLAISALLCLSSNAFGMESKRELTDQSIQQQEATRVRLEGDFAQQFNSHPQLKAIGAMFDQDLTDIQWSNDGKNVSTRYTQCYDEKPCSFLCNWVDIKTSAARMSDRVGMNDELGEMEVKVRRRPSPCKAAFILLLKYLGMKKPSIAGNAQ